jgi:hypothetical protein
MFHRMEWFKGIIIMEQYQKDKHTVRELHIIVLDHLLAIKQMARGKGTSIHPLRMKLIVSIRDRMEMKLHPFKKVTMIVWLETSTCRKMSFQLSDDEIKTKININSDYVQTIY